MSLFRTSDFAHKEAKSHTRKDQRVTQVKVKLPTQHKSKKRLCRICKNPAIHTISISQKENAHLCDNHYSDWKRKNYDYSVKFEKAKPEQL